MKQHLVIFDTTLRDGEQSPGASMTREEKIRVARQLEKMRVDVIEAGFAAASPGDFESIQAIAQAIKESTVCSLARANENDIRRAGEAIQPANSGRIHTFIATSPIHMEKKLRMTPDQVVEQAVRAIGWAREYTSDVEFSAEDATRSDLAFLCEVAATAAPETREPRGSRGATCLGRGPLSARARSQRGLIGAQPNLGAALSQRGPHAAGANVGQVPWPR